MEPVLLVEDKPELRAMLRKALERAGSAKVEKDVERFIP
jgi:CheY-like chemotaxis protein